MFEGAGKPLSEAALNRAAGEIGVGLPALWAVMTVETRSCGFLPDRRPQILFERHVFHKRTKGKFAMQDPDLSSPSAGGYGAGGAHQYERLERAIVLDRKAALESTSWGLGQVMGFNARAAGFADVEAMVAAMCDSEDAQFGAVVGFITSKNLSKYLKQEDWAGFAARYNGPDYAKNHYDARLAKASALFSAGPLPDLRLRAAQLYLTYLGYAPGTVDGWFGTNTRKALVRFQEDKGLEATGRLDDEGFAALERAALG